MSHRCINAFDYNNRVFPGGYQIEDNDPILDTHAAHFVRVGEVPSVGTETASAAPTRPRAVDHKPEPRRGRPRKQAISPADESPEEG